METDVSRTRRSYRAQRELLFLLTLFRIAKYCIRHGINPAALSRLNPGLPKGGTSLLPKSKNYEYILKNNLSAKRYYAKMISIPAGMPMSDVRKSLKAFGKYPVVLKPDQGSRSIGVFIAKTYSEVRSLIDTRGDTDYVAQEFIPFKKELGVFYYRYPDWKEGKILGIAEKIPKEGTNVSLHYVDRPDLMTPAVKRLFGNILKDKEIYFCRFDIKIKDFESFKKGKDFKILEVNAGPDAVILHALDQKYSLSQKLNKYMEGYAHVFRITDRLKHNPRENLIPYLWFLVRHELPLQLLRYRVRKLHKNVSSCT